MLAAAVDELYAADLGEFIARRSALATAASKAGDKDTAAAIGALKKPTRSAFTVNRLVRTDPAAAEELIELGEALRLAQHTADGGAIRDLSNRRRTMIEQLTSRAFELSGQHSPSAGLREDVSATLKAALADAEVARQIQAGTLLRAVEWGGFGFATGPGLAAVPPLAEPLAAPIARQQPDQHPADKPDPLAKAEAKRRQRRLDKAQRELDKAGGAVDDAQAVMRRQQQQVDLLQAQLAEARERLDDADLRLRRARKHQERAQQALHALD